MKRLLLFGLLGLSLLPGASKAADAKYENLGTVFNPQVDAVVFVNKGLFQASTAGPYETWDTRYFTNTVGTFFGSGTMDGTPGFRFSTTSSLNGMRTMASSFFNDNGAVVQANDGPRPYLYGCAMAPVGPSHLIVWASNITVKAGSSGSPKASLVVGANGEMELTGKNVDLSRSGIEVLPVWSETVGSGAGETNFSPDIAISDLYWGRTNYDKDHPLFSARLWNGSTARAQGSRGDVRPYGGPGFTIANPEADSYINVFPESLASIVVTNKDGTSNTVSFYTNMTKGAVFVGLGPGMALQQGFAGPNLAGYNSAAVLLAVQVSNAVTSRMEPAYLYVEDNLAYGGLGTTGMLTSIIGCPSYTTSRPANYYIDRGAYSGGSLANIGYSAGNNGYPTNDFFLSSGARQFLAGVMGDAVTNSVVEAGEYASYSAFADNVVTRPPPVAGGTVTNIPGRIRILADTLDMSRTRMRAEGEITIQSAHLISSSNAVVDCEHLSFNLASTNGNLKIQNLSPDTVNRFRGQIRVWSAIWSNTAVLMLTNYNVDSNGVAALEPLTNTITISFHTMMLDASELGVWQLPVTVHGFTSHSTNVLISDNMSVAESLLIDGRSLTIEGGLTLRGVVPVVNPILGYAPPGVPLQDWTSANAPTLLYLTNRGTFSIASIAHFGDDRTTPYSTFVNTGTVSAQSILLKSVYFENRGALTTDVFLSMQCGSGLLEGGSSTSGGSSQFLSGSLKFNKYQMTVNGTLDLLVTNALYDAGGASGNEFIVQNGFNLQSKPTTGDLLGTTIETVAPANYAVGIDHTWAGANRGAITAGYTNNTALGKLVVSSQSPYPYFYFSGTGNNNGMYVDQLDLSDLGTNYQNLVAIDPTLVIYFASAKVGFTPPPTNGVPQQPEEYLDGQFDSRLRWVRDFAGPNSSVAVVSNGVSISVNRALRNSKIIDSNGNGVPNYYDPYPFSASGVALTASLLKGNTPAISAMVVSWTAKAKAVYQVEYSSNPALNNWQPLVRYTNSATTNRVVSVTDTNAASGAVRRFYRVGFTP